jgi:hypothetical protein
MEGKKTRVIAYTRTINPFGHAHGRIAARCYSIPERKVVIFRGSAGTFDVQKDGITSREEMLREAAIVSKGDLCGLSGVDIERVKKFSYDAVRLEAIVGFALMKEEAYKRLKTGIDALASEENAMHESGSEVVEYFRKGGGFHIHAKPVSDSFYLPELARIAYRLNLGTFSSTIYGVTDNKAWLTEIQAALEGKPIPEEFKFEFCDGVDEAAKERIRETYTYPIEISIIRRMVYRKSFLENIVASDREHTELSTRLKTEIDELEKAE